jgi:hypothetical protein
MGFTEDAGLKPSEECSHSFGGFQVVGVLKRSSQISTVTIALRILKANLIGKMDEFVSMKRR